MAELQQTIADVCFSLEKAQSVAEIRRDLEIAADVLGADFYLFGIRTGRNITPPQQKVISNYPEAWQRYYDASGAFAFDPVLAKAMQVTGAFRWDGLHHDEQQLALRQKAVKSGMVYGFTCSDRGLEGSFGLLSFSGRHPFGPEPEQWELITLAAALLAMTTHKVVSNVIAQKSEVAEDLAATLTESERKCLEMMASAMTAEEAAEELHVKPRTVRYYLDRVAEKLGVETRREAVMKALTSGIIDPRRFPDANFGHGPRRRDSSPTIGKRHSRP